MNSTNPDLFTTIGQTRTAGNAGATMEIRYDGNDFTFFKSFGITGICQFSRQLMTQYPRVFKKWLGTFKGMKIGTTNADAADPEQG